MDFKIIGRITGRETIAVGRAIRELPRLRRIYGKARWRKRKGVARLELRDGTIRTAELHGTRRTALAAMNTRSRSTLIRRARVQRRAGTGRTRRGQFVLCIRADGYEVSLEPRKIYLALPDPDATTHDQIRLVDESGEDYLFPSDLFVPIEVLGTLRRALLAAV